MTVPNSHLWPSLRRATYHLTGLFDRLEGDDDDKDDDDDEEPRGGG